MKTVVLALSLSLCAACGGKDKPPLTPDQDDKSMSDGGSDMPTAPSPTAPTTPK